MRARKNVTRNGSPCANRRITHAHLGRENSVPLCPLSRNTTNPKMRREGFIRLRAGCARVSRPRTPPDRRSPYCPHLSTRSALRERRVERHAARFEVELLHELARLAGAVFPV